MNNSPNDKNVPLSYSIERLLAHYAEENGNRFLVEGSPIPSQTVFSPEMLLPVVALEAMRLWQSLERPANSIEPFKENPDESLGVTFMEVESSFFPLAAYPPLLVKSNNSTHSTASSLRLLCFSLASRRVFALKEGQDINLTPLIDAWSEIDWYGDAIKDIPIHDSFDTAFMKNEFERKISTHALRNTTSSPFASKKDSD